MKKTIAPFDKLRDIIFLYANTPPATVEHLRSIERGLMDPAFICDNFKHADHAVVGLDGSLYDGHLRAWEMGNLTAGTFNLHIETVIRILGVGEYRAWEIFSDLSVKDHLMSEIYGHETGFPPDIELRRTIYDDSFREIYGYMIASGCPCSLEKLDVLADAQLVEAAADPDERSLDACHWSGERLSCLQCDHVHFTSILRALSQGRYRYLHSLVKGYQRTSTEFVEFWSKARPLSKFVTAYGYEKNVAAFPVYLDGLPCNLLIDLISQSPGNARKIKECPICGKFFFAKNIRREICYAPECQDKEKYFQKIRQREEHPEIYGSTYVHLNPEYKRRKHLWERKAT